MGLLKSYPRLPDHRQELTDAERREAAFAEASTLINPREFGYFCVLYGTYDAAGKMIKKHQRSYPNRELRNVIDCMPLDRDTWISQGRFRKFGSRRLGDLQQINALWIDIDYYSVIKMDDEDGNEITCQNDLPLSSLLHDLEDRGFPLPSTVINSGAGLQIKWLLDKPILPRQLKAWKEAQRTLQSWFASIGADPRAMDASRVLRVVGTKHTKSNAIVEKIGGTDELHSFEYLSEFMPGVDLEIDDDHPYSQEEQDRMVAARLAREASYTARQARKAIKVVAEGERPRKLRKSAQSLNWARYNDLMMLHQIRAGKMPGQAMAHLFYTLNFLALSGAVTSTEFLDRAGRLCEQLGHGELARSDELTTLLYKLKQKEKGVTIEFAGHHWTPLYTPKNHTLIELFGITDDEQLQMKTIIGETEKKRRRAVRDGFKSDRAAYLAPSVEKRQKARSMAANNITSGLICEALGISRMTLSRYLRDTV